MRAAHAGEAVEAVDQSVYKCSGMHAGAGVDHHAGGLIDRDHVVILVEHGERDVLSDGVKRWRLSGFDGDCLARAAAPFTSTRPALIHS